METKQFLTLGNHKANIDVYASIKEGDDAAGREGAMLDEANRNLVYRGPLADARELFVEALEKETGIPRLTKDTGEKDDKGQPILEVAESDNAYYKRVCKTKGLEPETAPFQTLFDAAVNEAKDANGARVLMVDIKTRIRTGPKVTKLAQKFIDGAKRIIEAGRLDEAVSKFAGELGRTLSAADFNDPDKLGRLLKEVMTAREANALANL